MEKIETKSLHHHYSCRVKVQQLNREVKCSKTLTKNFCFEIEVVFMHGLLCRTVQISHFGAGKIKIVYKEKKGRRPVFSKKVATSGGAVKML